MKTALITGAAKRIGKKLAEHLHNAGYSIAIHYNTSKTEADYLHQQLKNSQVVFGDLQHSNSAGFVLDQINKPVDLIINNAAIFENDTITDFSLPHFYKALMINLQTPISFTHEAIKRYETCNIINIVDSWAHDHPNNFLSYSISKNALRDFTIQCAKQLPDGFRINAISCGFTLHKDGYPKDFFDIMQKKYPSSLEDVCNAVDNILSDEAMNGEIIELGKNAN